MVLVSLLHFYRFFIVFHFFVFVQYVIIFFLFFIFNTLILFLFSLFSFKSSLPRGRSLLNVLRPLIFINTPIDSNRSSFNLHPINSLDNLTRRLSRGHLHNRESSHPSSFTLWNPNLFCLS